MKLLSIIVPIFNVEPYLEKCLRSLVSQDILSDDYEIICINDGSTDNSSKVILRFLKEFHNIILIDQENQGVSSARNVGIGKAKGEYILFVDPDDYIMENSLDQILKTAALADAQVTIPGYTFLDQNGNLQDVRIYNDYEGIVFTGLEAYSISHKKDQVQADLSVGILFEANFLDKYHIRFLRDVPILEDGELLARIHCLAERCIFVPGSFYINMVRLGSATHSDLFASEKARKGFQLAATNLRMFQLTPNLLERQKLFINGPIVQFVLLTISSALQSRSFQKFRLTKNSLKSKGLDVLNLKGCSGYYLICGKTYNFSPYLGAIVSALYYKIESWRQFKLAKSKHIVYNFSLNSFKKKFQ